MRTDPAEFDKFIDCLPSDHEPWLIPTQKNKLPDVPKNESWKDSKYKLNVDEARSRLESGQNVGIALRDLVAFDIDDPERALELFPKNITKTTLTTSSRSGKPHIYFDKQDGMKLSDIPGVIESRTGWRYVLVPGSYAYDKKELEETGERNWGPYEIANPNQLARLTEENLPEELRKDMEEEEEIEVEGETETFENRHGWTLKAIRDEDSKLDALLSKLQPTSEDHEDCEYPSRSEADLAAANKLYYWEFGDLAISDILETFRPYEKTKRRDYIRRTLKKAKSGIDETITDNVDPQRWRPAAERDSEAVKIIEKGLKNLDFNPEKLARIYDRKEQETYYYSVKDTLRSIENVKEGLNKLRRNRISQKKNNIDKPDRKRVIGEAVTEDLKRKGKLLKGIDGGKFYYYEEEKQVYRFNELEGFLQRLYDISSSTQVGKLVKKRIKNAIENSGAEVKVKKLWFWDEKEKQLYVYDKDRHYFVLDGEEIKKKPNGIDGIYFLFDTPEDPIKYLPEEERDTDIEIPGKTSNNFKAGDTQINELLAGQTNFKHTTNLSAEQQRLQLLLHCYTFPFSELIPAKPIMLFTGRKGSTKSFTFKKIGRFYMNPDFRCRPLPGEDDFYVAVTKYPFTFLDNVEKKPDWLEDALARVATEVEIAKRKLYEDFKEAKRKPDTFLGLTAREIKFNRDDVMDRSLLFHAERIPENSFLREKDLERPLRENRHTLWSQYLDNLNKIVKKLKEGGLEDKQSNHRLADWACLAMEIAEALGYDEHYDINQIFEKMETERAAYTLKDSELYQTIKKAKAAETLTHGEFIPANQIEKELKNADQYFGKSAKSIGRELNSHEKEYGEIFGLKIETRGNSKAYHFPTQNNGDGKTGETKNKGIEKLQT